MRRAELRFSTTLFWRTDWRLASRATLLDVRLPDRCEVTALGVDATPLMRRVIGSQLASVIARADSAIPAVDVPGLTTSLRDQYAIPADRVFVAGLSAGGAMAAIMGETSVKGG